MTSSDGHYPRQPWDKPEGLSDDSGGRGYDLNGRTYGPEGFEHRGHFSEALSQGFRNVTDRVTEKAEGFSDKMDELWERLNAPEDRSTLRGDGWAGWNMPQQPVRTGEAPTLVAADPRKSWIRTLRRSDDSLERPPASLWDLCGGTMPLRMVAMGICIGLFVVVVVGFWKVRSVFEDMFSFAVATGGPFESPIWGTMAWVFVGGVVLTLVSFATGALRGLRMLLAVFRLRSALQKAGPIRPLRGIVVSSRPRRISRAGYSGDSASPSSGRSYVLELALVVELEDGTCQRFVNLLPQPIPMEIGDEPMPGQRACVWRTPDGWSLVQVNADV